MNPNMMGMMNPNMMGLMNMTGISAGQNITGSIKLLPAMMNGIDSQIKIRLGDAVVTAEKELGNNSRAVAAHLGVVNGYLVYFTWTVDTVPPTIAIASPDIGLHKLIIDPGNGKVLLSQKVSTMQMMNMMNGMTMNPNIMGMGNMMMNPNMMGMMNSGMMNKTGMMGHFWQ
jgi:hypothetical protein